MAKKFMGTDRRLMKKFKTITDAVHTRDQLALSGKKTAKLSTRELLVDTTDPATAVAWTIIRDIFADHIAAGKSASVTKVPFATAMGLLLNAGATAWGERHEKRIGKTATRIGGVLVSVTNVTFTVTSDATAGGTGQTFTATLPLTDFADDTKFRTSFQVLAGASLTNVFFNTGAAGSPYTVSFQLG